MVTTGMTALGKCHRKIRMTSDHGDHHFDQRASQIVDGPLDQLRAVVDGNDAAPPPAGPARSPAAWPSRASITSSALLPWRMITIPDTASPRPSRSRDSAPHIGPQHHLPHVLDPDRRAVLRCEHGLFQVCRRAYIPLPADHVLGAAELQQARARFLVAAANRLRPPLRSECLYAATGRDRR